MTTKQNKTRYKGICLPQSTIIIRKRIEHTHTQHTTHTQQQPIACIFHMLNKDVNKRLALGAHALLSQYTNANDNVHVFLVFCFSSIKTKQQSPRIVTYARTCEQHTEHA